MLVSYLVPFFFFFFSLVCRYFQAFLHSAVVVVYIIRIEICNKTNRKTASHSDDDPHRDFNISRFQHKLFLVDFRQVPDFKYIKHTVSHTHMGR